MAKVRLDDDYINHPKFTLLSDRAFRLWHEGMCYCRKLMTDGLIRLSELKVFRYFSVKAVKELTTRRGQTEPLWVKDPEGYRVHDYLDWNPSQLEEQQDRDDAKHRMRAYRGRARSPSVTARVTQAVMPGVTSIVTPSVPGEGKGKGIDPDPDPEKRTVTKPVTSLESNEVAERAGHLLQRYADLFTKHRNGAKLRLLNNSLEFHDACSLVTTWETPRLEKLAVLVLTTDDPFISGTDRSFKIFALKASWADEKLRAWEVEHGVTA